MRCEPGNAITLPQGVRLQVRQVSDTGPHLLLVTPREKPAASHAAATFALHVRALPLPRVHVRGTPPILQTCPLTAGRCLCVSAPARHLQGCSSLFGVLVWGRIPGDCCVQGTTPCVHLQLRRLGWDALQGRWLHCSDPKLALTHSISSSDRGY